MVGLLLLENHLSSPNWRETFYGTIFYSTAGHKIENQLLSFNSKNGSISEKKGREEQAGFLAVTRNLLNNNCWSPHNFCNQDFFFYVGGCLLLLLLCNLIWHSVLRTMRFWWTYSSIGSAKNATRHGNLFVIQNVNENDISGVRVNKPKTYSLQMVFFNRGKSNPKMSRIFDLLPDTTHLFHWICSRCFLCFLCVHWPHVSCLD